ncbi:IS3 family transposase [Dictyobacter kobayashii]|uniref:Integrase catalytic domain-containing protein n=1 Tax=Dictyobacter kobayashii TaxID=2014872 RepID=A0A402AVW8_9CHLR|nr:hypothetical protein KDK_70370 [Dictyobacter kobayashii]
MVIRNAQAGMHLTGTFLSHEEARTALFEYISVYYNRVRKHSTLGYLSPVQFEVVKNRLFTS